MTHAARTVTIDDRPYPLDDPDPKGRDLLELAGRYPVDEHLLFFRQQDGTYDDINLAQEVPLVEGHTAVFRTVRADRVFYFVVDGRRFPWGDDGVTGADIRKLADIAADRQLMFDPKQGSHRPVADAERIDLAERGVEHFYTADLPPKPVWVMVELNGEKVKILAGPYVTETLKEALGVAAQLDLDVVDAKGSFRTLKPGEAIDVVADMKFVSHVRQGGSS